MMRGIEEFKVTHMALAPPTVVWMARDDNNMDGYDLSSLEVVGCGGAALQRTVIERFKKRFPRVQLAQKLNQDYRKVFDLNSALRQ